MVSLSSAILPFRKLIFIMSGELDIIISTIMPFLVVAIEAARSTL